MNLSSINFLISLNVMKLWNTSTIITQINQVRLTGMNNLLIWRTQSFYHESFLANSHTHSNMTIYIIFVCHSAGKLCACTYDSKTHQHVFITSTRFAEPQQGLWNLNKVFWTLTRFSETSTRFSKTLMRFMLLQQGNTSGLLRTGWILEGGWYHDVITWYVHRSLIRVR